MTDEKECWYRIAANGIFGMGRVTIDAISQRFPEWDRDQIRSALKLGRVNGMIVMHGSGNRRSYEAVLKAPNSVWQLANHV